MTSQRMIWCATVLALLVALCLRPAPARADIFTWEAAAPNPNWDSPLNWAGTANAVPDDNTDSALVNSQNNSPTLNAHRTIGALTIQSGADVYTGSGANNYSLTVQESLTQNGRTLIENAGSSLTVRQSPMANDFDTDDLIINSGGSLILHNGAKVQVDRLADLNAGGTIAGQGILEINGQDYFYNDGTMRASGGGTLTLNSTGLLFFDLDGVAGNGTLIADSDSTLVIPTGTVGPYQGSMFILQNGTIQMSTPLQVDDSPGSRIDFYGGNGTATLNASWITVQGEVHVQTGTAVFASPTFIGNSADFRVHEAATVQFDAASSISDPESVVNEYNTTWIVNDELQIGSGVGNFNWDGLGQNLAVSGHTTVNANGNLLIDVARIDEAGTDERYHGTITINSGRIDVQNDSGEWELGGDLVMNNVAAQAPVLSGADLLVTGDVVAGGTGASRIEANATFQPTSSVQVDANANLKIGSGAAGSQTEIRGGTWTGTGDIDLNALLTTVATATTVNMPNGTFDLDGDLTGAQLVLNAPLTLNVASMDDLNSVVNDDVRINSAGRLSMNLTDANATYGIATTLDLNGLGGALSSLHLTGSKVRLLGTTNVAGNSAATARVDILGQMNIAGAGSFQIRSGTADDPSWVRAGANISGTGDLVVSQTGPGYLRLENGANIGVELINRGYVDLGPASASATVAAFTQPAAGTLVASIDGLAPDTQYDQLTVLGVADLAGTLEIEINEHGGAYADPIAPGVFDEFELILALDVDGQFDEFTYGGDALALSFSGNGQDRFHVGSGLFRILDYDATELDLLNYRALQGDANGDGTVDGSDFGIWNANRFAVGTDWTSGDFNGDGVTDGSDFAIWNSNKFTSITLGRPPGSTLQAVPEPSAVILMMIGITMLIVRRRPTDLGC